MIVSRTFSELKIAILVCIIFLTKTGYGFLGSECWALGMCGPLECINFVCTCRAGYIPSADNSECVIDINGECITFSDKCYDSNASCDQPGAKCTCNKDHTQHSESQLCLLKLGISCQGEHDTPCVDGSCVDGRCQCGNGLVPSQFANKCGIAVGGTCSSGGTSCADPFAECTNGNICECETGYKRVVDSNGLTICQTVLGGHCVATNECAGTNILCETMLNGKGICNCKGGFVPSGDRKSCLPVTNQWRGECQEDTQCIAAFGRHSVCQSNICACANGYEYSYDDFGCVL